MKPVLLVVDIQKQFFGVDPVMTQSLNNAIRYINAAIGLFRKKELPVIAIQHVAEAGGLVPGAEGFELPDELNVLPSDEHIHKHYGNAFNKTSLEAKLRELDVDTLIITGFCAEHCVLSTYRGAEDVDLTPIVLRGALASDNLEHIKFVENINEVISLGALRQVLG